MAKPVTLRPTRPNLGIEAAYRKRLDREIAAMNRSVLYWISAQYKAAPPVMAQDVSPAVLLNRAMKRLARRWQRNFDVLADTLATKFSDKAFRTADASMAAAMKKAGWTVPFKLTATVNDALQATTAENVALIKSIPSEYMTQVQGAVMRSVTAGRDLGPLAAEIEQQYGVTKRRAALIARDQNNKATATIVRVRQEGLGIKEAIWLHSAGGKKPRQSHVDFSGKRYNIAEGALIDGEYIFPGQLINCRCVSKSVIPGLS